MAESSTGLGPLAHALVACCVVGVGACDIVRDPTALDIDGGPISVHGMLVAGDRRIAVLVTRYELADSPNGELGSNHRLVPVADADVRIIGAGQTVTLKSSGGAADDCIDTGGYSPAEIPASLATGCYTAVAQNAIAAGSRYELQIRVPGSSMVTGATEVPRPVTIRVPAGGASVEVRSSYDRADPAPPHPFAWSGTQPDRALRLRLEADINLPSRAPFGDEPCRQAWTPQALEDDRLLEPQDVLVPDLQAGVMYRAIDLTARDSVDIRGWYLYCDGALPAELTGRLQLAVFDLDYALYLDRLARSESIPLEVAGVGVSGAAGVFTGIAVTRLPVRLVVR